MQKYQNFLVKAGRQCWPGDNTGMADKIGRRPYDVALYEWPSTNLGWITNIIYGGAAATGTGTSFTSNDAQTGLFVDADYSDFLGVRTPVDYKNGLKESSLCTQCCNSEHNCNLDWQPRTEGKFANFVKPFYSVFSSRLGALFRVELRRNVNDGQRLRNWRRTTTKRSRPSSNVTGSVTNLYIHFFYLTLQLIVRPKRSIKHDCQSTFLNAYF